MLKLKYRKEMQEEMKSEKESPLEKTNKDILLPLISHHLGSIDSAHMRASIQTLPHIAE